MAEIVESFLIKAPSWIISSNGAALSSRIRLVRNLSEFPFATSANLVQKKSVREKVFSTLESYFKSASIDVCFIDAETLTERDINILLGLHLINYSFSKDLKGKGLCLSKDGSISILVNEVDHIKIHVYSENLAFEKIYSKANSIDDHLIQNLNISFSEELGFLTACPTNIGTALRASSILHIPSVVATGEINDIAKFLGRKDIVIRGLFGNEEGLGDIFQLSNTETLGKTEEEIIGEVFNVSEQLIKREKELRKKLISSSSDEIQDRVNKSKGIISYAKFMSLREAFEIISLFRMAKLAGLLPEIELEKINNALLKISPEMIRAIDPNIKTTQEENKLRAEILKQILNEK